MMAFKFPTVPYMLKVKSNTGPYEIIIAMAAAFYVSIGGTQISIAWPLSCVMESAFWDMSSDPQDRRNENPNWGSPLRYQVENQGKPRRSQNRHKQPGIA